MQKWFWIGLLIAPAAMGQLTRFEQTKGTESAPYAEAIAWYKQWDAKSPKVLVKDFGLTDAGYPLQVVLLSADGVFDPATWQRQQRAVIMVNNGIHPGEPDGIDASMMLVRDLVTGRQPWPAQVVLGIVPVYNIGGALNRGSYSRANQNGPKQYGFRGNAQNLDLNRDFTKADSRNAQSFARAFHWLQPHILIDNHVSDGADFQHVFTLLTTQYDKLGQPLGTWLRNTFEPALYRGMAQKGWQVFPYVNFDSYDLARGMTQFYDPPRYSSGYAALFGCIGFVPETHMLKPYKERVQSTYDFMVTTLQTAAAMRQPLLEHKKQTLRHLDQARQWPLAWAPNRTQADTLSFLGYERDTIISTVTGLPQMRYNRQRPFTAPVTFYSYFTPSRLVSIPRYYVLQQGWHSVVQRLQENGVRLQRLKNDSTLTVTTYRITDYKTSPSAYEKHYRHSDVQVSPQTQTLQLLAGDYLIPTNQPARRYLVEMLEPAGDDGFFAWNYFDAILQQKEGYSDYRWEEVAAQWLPTQPALKAQLDALKQQDSAFAKNPRAILNWVYRQSPYYEPVHMRHPVFRIE